MAIDNTKVVTGKVRFSFVNVFEPRAFGDNQTPKFSVMLMIPKSDVDTLKRMKGSNRCRSTERSQHKIRRKITSDTQDHSERR